MVEKSIQDLMSLMQDLSAYSNQFLEMVCDKLKEYKDICNTAYRYTVALSSCAAKEQWLAAWELVLFTIQTQHNQSNLLIQMHLKPLGVLTVSRPFLHFCRLVEGKMCQKQNHKRNRGRSTLGPIFFIFFNMLARNDAHVVPVKGRPSVRTLHPPHNPPPPPAKHVACVQVKT